MTKILVVDDSKDNCYLLEILLKGNGYEVVSTLNGAEALEKLRSQRFDMIISDIMMPVMDGFQLCQQCKKDAKLKNIPFVFYTATYTDARDEELAQKMGGDKFIRKPAEPDEFMKQIQDVLRNFSDGKMRPAKPVETEEKEVLKLYNERLVHKLEHKNIELEEAIARYKISEENLKTSEYRLRNILENVTAGIIVATKDGHFINANKAALAIYGFDSEEDLIKTPVIARYVNIEDRERLIKLLQEKDKVTGFETRLRRRDGTQFWASLGVINQISASGEKQLLSIIEDITERKKAEEEIKQGYEKLQQTLDGVTHAIAAAIEIRDPYTSGHQRRVSKLAGAIAREMGLTDEQAAHIQIAALIHDIGKISIPSEILSRPGELSELEFSLIKSHPQAGYTVLHNIDFPYPVARWVLEHHERMNGSGYPSGLSGDGICLESRIIAVADVVEAMSSHRPYRSALGTAVALAEIKKNKGILYDGKVVDACLKLFTEKDFDFE